MRVDEFDFDLDPSLIALHPARPRDAARLLVVPTDDAPFVDAHIGDLPDHLRAGDVLVVNDTRVIAAALSGLRERDGAVARLDFNLLEPVDASRWRALARPAKRLKPGDRVRFGEADRACGLTTLWAEVEEQRGEGEVVLAFEIAGPDLDLALEAVGVPPLPPYIARKRPVEDADRADYQTMFAREPGAVAAPTAGLHFTDRLLAPLHERGIEIVAVTLHVGPGTFLPVKADDTEDHVMHVERGTLSETTAGKLNEAREAGGRIVAVGTTALRLLETATGPDGRTAPFSGSTSLFITPGYRFRAVDLLMTNFHLPRSTLFMLVAAFSGLARIRSAYAHAIAARYRFYSYGDACLLERSP